MKCFRGIRGFEESIFDLFVLSYVLKIMEERSLRISDRNMVLQHVEAQLTRVVNFLKSQLKFIFLTNGKEIEWKM